MLVTGTAVVFAGKTERDGEANAVADGLFYRETPDNVRAHDRSDTYITGDLILACVASSGHDVALLLVLTVALEASNVPGPETRHLKLFTAPYVVFSIPLRFNMHA